MIGIPAALALLALVVWLGLPAALRGLGLHRHYEIPPFDLSGKKALIIATNHATLGESGKATGAFGSEFSVPYYAFLDGGLEVDIASPAGGRIPVEPNSMGWPLATDADRRFKRDATAMRQLEQSLPISEVDPSTRMLETRRGPDFAEETVGSDHRGQRGLEHLHRDLAPVLQIGGEIHGRHAALAQLALDAIAALESRVQAGRL
jgi:hypothetical protein